MNDISLSIIVAYARNRVIGHNGDMPWRQRDDLRNFRTLTMDKAVIMGRKTFETLRAPLTGRRNIVVSRSLGPIEGVDVVGSIDEAIDLARTHTEEIGLSEFFVIGGGHIYTQTIDLADYIYVTEIDADIEGDTYFPEIDPNRFVPFVVREGSQPDKDNTYGTRYVTYHRL